MIIKVKTLVFVKFYEDGDVHVLLSKQKYTSLPLLSMEKTKGSKSMSMSPTKRAV